MSMAWSQTPASSVPFGSAGGRSSAEIADGSTASDVVALPNTTSHPRVAAPASPPEAEFDTPTAPSPATQPGPPPGSPAWLAEQWQEHRRWVAAIVLAHMPRWADLDDLLQEVALAVVRKGAEVRDPEAFRPWLRTVAINAARLAARRGALRETATSLEAFSGDPGNAGVGVIARIGAGSGETRDRMGASDLAALDEEGRRLVELARTLPDGYGEPLLLKAVQGMSYREIGRVLGLPETTVETRIARARRMLREAAAGGHA
jgi:RNA polymerase sigma-70 factor (ECF subfamily)